MAHNVAERQPHTDNWQLEIWTKNNDVYEEMALKPQLLVCILQCNQIEKGQVKQMCGCIRGVMESSCWSNLQSVVLPRHAKGSKMQKAHQVKLAWITEERNQFDCPIGEQVHKPQAAARSPQANR